jgi:hypothetical protein
VGTKRIQEDVFSDVHRRFINGIAGNLTRQVPGADWRAESAIAPSIRMAR